MRLCLTLQTRPRPLVEVSDNVIMLSACLNQPPCPTVHPPALDRPNCNSINKIKNDKQINIKLKISRIKDRKG